VNELNAQGRGHVCQHVSYVKLMNGRNFVIRSLHYILSIKFNFVLCQSNMGPTLCEDRN